MCFPLCRVKTSTCCKSISLFDTGCANVRFLHAISGLVNVNIYICSIRIKAKTIFG